MGPKKAVTPTMEDFLDMLSQIREDIAKSKESLQGEIKALNLNNVKILNKLQKVDSENSKLASKCSELEKANITLSSQVNKLMKDSKAKNMFIYKVEDTDIYNADLLNKVGELISKYYESFDISTIDEIRRIGRKAGNRPIFIKFTSVKIKSTIFSHIVKVKDKAFSIANDLTDEEIKVRNELQPLAYKLRESGIDAKLKNGKIAIGTKHHFSHLGQDIQFTARQAANMMSAPSAKR